MDLKLELIAVPVTDVDRAKAFYEKVGFNPDHDHTVSENLRFVQLTPPGAVRRFPGEAQRRSTTSACRPRTTR
jgi:hypothetical protein